MNLFKKNTIGFTVLAFVIFSVATQYATANDDSKDSFGAILKSLSSPPAERDTNNYATIIKAIRAFNEASGVEDEKNTELQTRWDTFLSDNTHYSNDDYTYAIEIQAGDYQKAVVDFSNIIKVNNEMQKSTDSSLWINDLINHFGKAYIVKNRKSIQWSLLALSNFNDAYTESLKELIFRETMLYGSYQRYFSLFLNFYYDKLDDNGKKQMGPRQKFAAAFLKIITKPPIKSMHDDTVLLKKMNEHKAQQLSNDIFEFMQNHPLSNRLDPMQAMDDLMQVLN